MNMGVMLLGLGFLLSCLRILYLIFNVLTHILVLLGCDSASGVFWRTLPSFKTLEHHLLSDRGTSRIHHDHGLCQSRNPHSKVMWQKCIKNH